VDNKEVVYCETLEQWEFVNSKLDIEIRLSNEYFIKYNYKYKNLFETMCWREGVFGCLFYKENNYKIYTFNEWLINRNLKIKNEIGMKELMLDVLNKTYDNLILRKSKVPLFMSNPGLCKTIIAKEFANSKAVNMLKITLSQRLPNEVVGMMMPNVKSGKLEVFDSYELEKLKDGDILFLDELLNGTLKQTLDAVLNLLEDRTLPSGQKLANVMIIAASNPQGLINITPQIKERFIRYDLKFNSNEFKDYLKCKYGMNSSISNNICTLINKEKFDNDSWNYVTPRSIEKAINQIGCDLKSNYDDILMPYLNEEIEIPMDISINNIEVKKEDKVKYIEILKLIIKNYNDTENRKQTSRASSNILN